MADAVCGRLCGAGILLDTTSQGLIDFLEFDLCGGDRRADERHHEASVDLALDDLGVRIGVDRVNGLRPGGAILKTTRLPACICPAARRMCGCHSG